MSLNVDMLVSGCGISHGAQTSKTWVNVLRACGVTITDQGGPAVSNRWIISRAVQHLEQNRPSHAVVQLTNLGKLDVEITPERQELIDSSPLRSFAIDGVWPSSHCHHHHSKQSYYRWLCSPNLERADLCAQVVMLGAYCQQRGIALLVLEGYPIDWTPDQELAISRVIRHENRDIYGQYQRSPRCRDPKHNHVPHLWFQIELAERVATWIDEPVLAHRLQLVKQRHAEQD